MRDLETLFIAGLSCLIGVIVGGLVVCAAHGNADAIDWGVALAFAACAIAGFALGIFYEWTAYDD